jgi:hypothetical protein
MTEKEFFNLINKYFSTLSKVEKIENRINQFHLTYDPEYDEEIIALETYRREIEYYLPDFLEK